MEHQSFSKRLGYTGQPADITITNEAPEFLRYSVTRWAESAGLHRSTQYSIACDRLRLIPGSANWPGNSPFFDLDAILRECEWYMVYDLIEEFSSALTRYGTPYEAAEFRDKVNEYFVEAGVGWKLENDRVVNRGDEEFESHITAAAEALSDAGYSTAKSELHEALKDLSRRPQPDLTGAISHAMAAMECVAREYCGDPRATFGELKSRFRDMIPPPLDSAVEKAWGYASEMGRHLREGRDPERDEAELVVGIAAVLSTYLTKKKAHKKEA